MSGQTPAREARTHGPRATGRAYRLRSGGASTDALKEAPARHTVMIKRTHAPCQEGDPRRIR